MKSVETTTRRTRRIASATNPIRKSSHTTRDNAKKREDKTRTVPFGAADKQIRTEPIQRGLLARSHEPSLRARHERLLLAASRPGPRAHLLQRHQTPHGHGDHAEQDIRPQIQQL